MTDSSHEPMRPSRGAGLNGRLLGCLEEVSRASSCLVAVVGLAVTARMVLRHRAAAGRIAWPHAGESGHSARIAFGRLRALDASPSEGRPRLCIHSLLALTAASLIIALGLVTLAGYFLVIAFALTKSCLARASLAIALRPIPALLCC